CHRPHRPTPLRELPQPPPLRGSARQRFPAWSENQSPRAPPLSPDLRRLAPTPSANTIDIRSADSNSTSLPTGSPRSGSSLACLLVRSIDGRPRPNAGLSWETRCHPRSRPPLLRALACWATHTCVTL